MISIYSQGKDKNEIDTDDEEISQCTDAAHGDRISLSAWLELIQQYVIRSPCGVLRRDEWFGEKKNEKGKSKERGKGKSKERGKD